VSGPHPINLSTAWEPPDPAADRAAWTRHFGLPAGIEPGVRVRLVVEASAGCEVVFAGESLATLAAGEVCRHDVTGRLGPRNELVLLPRDGRPSEVGSRLGHGRLPLPATLGRVRLEIEPAGDGPATAPA